MDELVKRAREVMNGVTPGPWYIGAQNDALYVIDGPPSPSPYDGPIPKSYGPNVVCTPEWRDMPTEKNARFIAAARSLVPEMADAIEALQAQLAEARDKALPALDMAAESLEWAIREMDEYASILSRERCTASRAAETTVEEVRDAIRAMKGERG